MKKHLIYWLAAAAIVMIGCQKELSFEGANTPGHGSLQSDITGDCLPKTVNGIYIAASPLVPATNTITVQINVIKTGTYVVTTDTVNGYFFRATGTFTTLGVNNVTLRSSGTPFAAGVNNFVVSFDTTICDIAVTVLPVGSGPAVFTLTGAPGSCGSPLINGTYVKSVPLSMANTVQLNVNVTVAGTYNVTTTATNGMTFSGSGSLAAGPQTITLNGTGTPTNSGSTTIPVTAGTSTCSFVINVVPPIAGTLGGGPGACTPATVNGIYTTGIALTASNTVQVQITTAAVGPYIVSTNTVDGFSFSGTGTSTGAAQTITLNGTGTPTAGGVQNFTVTFGTSTCTFSVTVAPPAVYTINCAGVVVNGSYLVGMALNGAVNTIDLPITVTTAGPYSISVSVNGMTFSASGILALGPTTITLTGSGTPLTSGISSLSVGAPACLIPISVAGINWKFNLGSTVYQGSTGTTPGDVTYDPTSAPPFTLFDYFGDNPAADNFSFSLIDLTGGILANETYNSNSIGLTNIGAFYFTNGAGTIDLSADPSMPTVNIIFKITSHNTATKTIIGTFSGTAHDAVSGTTKTITSGTFTAVYP
jgi:hypothetical protein